MLGGGAEGGRRMRYASFTVEELQEAAERDPRYGVDPLFTELVARAALHAMDVPEQVRQYRSALTHVR